LPRVVQHALDLSREVIAEAKAIADKKPQPPTSHFAKEVVDQTERHAGLLEAALAPKVNGAV
jgi:hypothetical protein